MTVSNISTTLSSTSYQSPNWYEDLWQSSRRGDLNEIKSIIEHFNITLANFPGEFAGCFIVAGEKGHKDVIEHFLSLNVLKIIRLKDVVYGLESDLASEFHEGIVGAVITFIKSDKDSPTLPGYRSYDLFRTALAENRIKLVKAITKSIDPSYLYDALKSMLEKGCIESEGFTISRYYGDLIEATIGSLTPELSWEIIKMDAGVVNSGSTSHTKVVEAVIKPIDPSFLCNVLKSSIEEKRHAEEPITLGYYKSLIEIAIKSLAPELLYKVFILASIHNEDGVITAIVNSISVECLCSVLHLSLEQNRAEAIKNVINSERILSSDNYGKAFIQAVKSQQIDVIQFFINSSRFITLGLVYLEEALNSSHGEIKQMIKNSDRVRNLNITEF